MSKNSSISSKILKNQIMKNVNPDNKASIAQSHRKLDFNSTLLKRNEQILSKETKNPQSMMSNFSHSTVNLNKIVRIEPPQTPSFPTR